MHVSENVKIGKKDLRSPEKYCILRSHRDWKRSEIHTKSSGVATSFVGFAAFFLSYARKKRSETVLTDDDLSEEVLILLSGKCPRRFHRNLQVEKGENVCQEIREKV